MGILSGVMAALDGRAYIPLALTTVTGWGIAPLIIKKAYDKSPVIHALVAMTTASTIIGLVLPACASTGILGEAIRKSLSPDFSELIGPSILAVMLSLLYITYLEGLKRADVSIATALTSFYPLLSIMLGVVFSNEHTNVYQVAAVGGVVAGMVLMGQQPRRRVHVEARVPVIAGGSNPGLSEPRLEPVVEERAVFAGMAPLGLALILVTMFGYGVSPVVTKNVVHSSGAYFIVYSFIRPAIVGCYGFYLRSKGSDQTQGPVFPTDRWLWFGATIGTIADTTSLLAVLAGPIAVVIPLSALYPLVTMVLARAFFKSTLARVQYTGIVMAVSFMALALLAGKIGG